MFINRNSKVNHEKSLDCFKKKKQHFLFLPFMKQQWFQSVLVNRTSIISTALRKFCKLRQLYKSSLGTVIRYTTSWWPLGRKNILENFKKYNIKTLKV